MLSYRHAFHAGNPADVLKHTLLIHALDYMVQKEKPLLYVDTHAGSGKYRLDEGFATLNKEHETGFGRLQCSGSKAPELQRYLEVVEACCDRGEGSFYPGSPWIAAQLLRHSDGLRLHEIHPADYEALVSAMEGDPRVSVLAKDGFGGVVKAVPPPSRRALVLVDPPYEVKTDYEAVVDALTGAVARFSGGVYAVWYPLLESGAWEWMKEELERIPNTRWLWVEFLVRKPGKGLYGSGMWWINPPWTMPDAVKSLEACLPAVLGQDDTAQVRWDSHLP
jgi:23S rRNA (adenine2030-N6)-methyltransferase